MTPKDCAGFHFAALIATGDYWPFRTLRDLDDWLETVCTALASQ
jgi:hypothetical protein